MSLTPTLGIARKAGLGLLLAMAIPAMAMAADSSLTIGMSTTFTTIDPHETSSSPNNAASRHIFDSLINRGGAAENNPQLATEWKIIDPTHWEFHLRKDVKFHDGSTFDAEDVIASLLRARDKPSQAFASYTRNIKDVSEVDPYTVMVETTVPDPMILNSLSRIRIISADHAQDSVADFDSGKAAIGTGPFKFVSYSPGDRLVLERNDDYFGGLSEWKNVTLRMIPDNGARLAALLSGDLDLIETMPAEGVDRVESSDNLQLIRGQSTRLVYLGVNVNDAPTAFITAKDGSKLDKNPLQDERVRRALLMSINRPAIVDRVMQKNGTVADQFVAKGYFGHSDVVEPVKYDPTGAKKLLEEAGWGDGFKITIQGPAGRYVNDSAVLQAVGQMFSRVGIETSVEVMPWSMYSKKYATGDYSLYLGSWGINTGEVSNPALAVVAGRNDEKGTGRYNGGNVNDPEINKLLDEATSTLDEASRKPLLEKVSELTFNKLWILPLHYENVVLAAKKSISYAPRGDKYTLAYDIKSTAN
jgi:peptide/nickel transport system substrate-binding protein